MEDLEVSTGSLEGSIKRVVCIEDGVVDRSVVITEVMCSSVTAADVKVIDVVSGSEECEGEDASLAGNFVDAGRAPEAKVIEVVDTSDQLDDQSSKVVQEQGQQEIEQEIEQEQQGEENPVPASEDSDSEDDLQLIVNDEDIFYPHGMEGAEEVEGEEVFGVAGEEHYEEVDWAAEMHYHHSQFKYVRPGAGPATTSPGVPPDPQTPGAKGVGPMPYGGYGMPLWDYSFQPAYEFVLPPSKTVFDIDIDQFEEKPWDYEGTDLTDYFNFGFTEETWKQYCEEFARAKVEASTKSKMRGHDNGHSQQGWNYDNARYNDTVEPPRGRNNQGQRGMRNQSGRLIQTGGTERRHSDLRRQRHRDPEPDEGRYENNQGEVRRKERTIDLTRRKGFSRQSELSEYAPLSSSPLSGRLGGRTPPEHTNLGGNHSSGMFSTPSGRRSSVISTRTSPGGVQGSVENGFRTLSKRLSEEEETPPKRSPPRVERAYASAPQRRSSAAVTDKQPTSLVRRVTQLVNETKSPQERKSPSTAEPARRKTIQLNTERRSQLVSERKAIAERRAERRLEATTERRQLSLRATEFERDEEEEQEQPARTARKRVEQPRQITRPSSLVKSEDRPKLKQQDGGAKDDLRMKVLEKVSARWKLHLRMDDAHARRKRESLSKPADQKDNEEGTSGFQQGSVRDTKTKYAVLEDLEDDNRRERREERKRRHKDRKERRRLRSEDDDYDLSVEYYEDYEEVDERWQMEDADFTGREYRNDRKRKRRRFDEALETEEEEENDFSERRLHRHTESRYTRRDYNDDDAWEMEEGECEEDAYLEDVECEDDRWEDNSYAYKRKRRRYNEELTDVDGDYETDTPGNDERDYSYDESPPGQAEDVFYRSREKFHHRETDRWNGTLYDSCDEYEEYEQ